MMLRPLNSEIARRTVRRSAPSTSRLKLPLPVRTSPTCEVAVDADPSARAGAATEASARPATRVRPSMALLASILISLPHQWNHHRLCLPFRRQVHDHAVALEALDEAVLHL